MLKEGDRYKLTVDGNEYFAKLILLPDPNVPDDPTKMNWFAVSEPYVRIPGWGGSDGINRSYSDVLGGRQREASVIRELNELGMEKVDQELNIAAAPHIGDLKLNLNKDFPDGNSITYTPFINGEELVRLEGNNSFIFKVEGLHQWFDSGHLSNPLSGLPITQENIERFTYVEDTTKGGLRRRIKSLKHRSMRRRSKSRKNLRKKY